MSMDDRITDDKPLTESDIERIAEKAAERALEKVYSEVGRSVVKKGLWIVGALAIGFAAAKGWLKP
jgi:hypothetical protein